MHRLWEDFPEYRQLPLIHMCDNGNGNLPVYVRTYNASTCTHFLHRHGFIQINYVAAGKGRHIINDAAFEVKKGDIFVIPPFIPHLLEQVEGSDFEIFELEFEPTFILGETQSIELGSIFDFAYIDPFLVSIGEIRPRLNLNGRMQHSIENLLSDIYQEYTAKASDFLLSIKASLLKILVYLGRAFKEEVESAGGCELYAAHRDAIKKALCFIDENYMHDIKIEEVSRVATLSRSYFCYLFKTLTGKTFIEYLSELRVEKAVQLLKATDEMITEVSTQCGFNNISNFNRVFKQSTGLSPRQYRSAFTS